MERCSAGEAPLAGGVAALPVAVGVQGADGTVRAVSRRFDALLRGRSGPALATALARRTTERPTPRPERWDVRRDARGSAATYRLATYASLVAPELGRWVLVEDVTDAIFEGHDPFAEPPGELLQVEPFTWAGLVAPATLLEEIVEALWASAVVVDRSTERVAHVNRTGRASLSVRVGQRITLERHAGRRGTCQARLRDEVLSGTCWRPRGGAQLVFFPEAPAPAGFLEVFVRRLGAAVLGL
jgi:hypothetical protein